MEKHNLIEREHFCNDLLQRHPEWYTKKQIIYKNVEELYDDIFYSIARYLEEDANNRVYLPKIGSLYTDNVPANTDRGLPPRIRYRVSCKPFVRKYV